MLTRPMRLGSILFFKSGPARRLLGKVGVPSPVADNCSCTKRMLHALAFRKFLANSIASGAAAEPKGGML